MTSLKCVIVGVDESELDPLREAYQDVDVQTLDRPLESIWIDGAKLALTKQSPRWFELRRDQLGPSDPLRPILPQLRLVTAAATLFRARHCHRWLVAGPANRAGDRTDQCRSACRVRGSFPRFPDTRGAASSHTKRTHQSDGSRGATAEIDVPQSATEVLRELLAALPSRFVFA